MVHVMVRMFGSRLVVLLGPASSAAGCARHAGELECLPHGGAWAAAEQAAIQLTRAAVQHGLDSLASGSGLPFA